MTARLHRLYQSVHQGAALACPRTSLASQSELTRCDPSAIVRASPLAHRQATRPSHARHATPLAEHAVAFIPQVPPLTR